MYRIALISDVHANLPALEAVLEDARSIGADMIWNLGDTVGYGPFPNETVERLAAIQALSVLGNGDDSIVRFSDGAETWRSQRRPEKIAAMRWTRSELDDRNLDRIAGLPTKLRVDVAERRALLVHGTVESIKEPLYADTPNHRLEELSRRAPADFVFCGHSHEAFARELPAGWFVNPGSVGRQIDGDPRARYAALEITRDSVRVRLRKVPYDLEAVVEGFSRSSLPPALLDSFVEGRSLHWLEGHQRSKVG